MSAYFKFLRFLTKLIDCASYIFSNEMKTWTAGNAVGRVAQVYVLLPRNADHQQR